MNFGLFLLGTILIRKSGIGRNCSVLLSSRSVCVEVILREQIRLEMLTEIT